MLGPKPGQVEGRLVDDRGRPASANTIVLAPAVHRNHPELFVLGTEGAGGSFTIANVPPGDYALFAWEALEPYTFFDPGVLQRYENQGRPVRVGESSKTTLDVKVIPR